MLSMAIAHRRMGPAHQRYGEPELWFGTAELARRILPRPTPTRSLGGQAPAQHFLILPSAISLQFGERFDRGRAGIEP